MAPGWQVFGHYETYNFSCLVVQARRTSGVLQVQSELIRFAGEAELRDGGIEDGDERKEDCSVAQRSREQARRVGRYARAAGQGGSQPTVGHGLPLPGTREPSCDRAV